MARDLGDHCYNIPSESIYGEITANSILKLVSFVKCNTKTINIIDIGSGSGYSLVNLAKAFPDTQVNIIGIEVSVLRAELSETIIPKIKSSNIKKWTIYNKDILKMQSLPLIDLSFSFDKTFTIELLTHIMKLQLNCSTLQYVISCHSYSSIYWMEIGRVPCRLRGSGQIITFFVFMRKK